MSIHAQPIAVPDLVPTRAGQYPLPRVGIDLTYLAPQRTGLAMYALNLLSGLAQDNQVAPYVVFVSHAGQEYLPSLPSNFTVVSLPVPHAARFGMEQLLAPVFMHQRLDVLHSLTGAAPLLYSRPTVVTITDLSFAHAPQTMTPKARLYFGTLLPASARRAALVLTLSRTVRDELCRFNPRLRPERVVAVPAAIHPRYLQDGDAPVAAPETLARYGITPPYILFVGTLEPRKNLGLVLRAFARLRGAGCIPHRLVLVGRAGWLQQSDEGSIHELRRAKEIVETGYLPDDDLPALYRNADLFVFPSLYEGFGLPPVEAMACGTPVIASDIPVLREVSGDAALYVDPQSVDDLCQAMLAVLTDSDVRARLVREGHARARHYTPLAVARATAEVYRTVARAAAQ